MPAVSSATHSSAPARPAARRRSEVAELAALAGARTLADTPIGSVTGVALHAGHTLRGDLFAALPGLRVHGADFAAEALAAGAAALLTDPAGATRSAVADASVPVLVHPDPRAVVGPVAARVYGDPTRSLAVLGVTGTSGKTTVSYLIEAGLRAAGRSTGLVGTVQTRVGDTVADSALTTPEAPDLQGLFALMLERGVSDVAMEVSSHALDQDRVAGTRFAVGAFTNLSQDHLDYHRDMDGYFAAKARLFDGRARTEVVSVDDEWGRRLRRPGTVTVSVSGHAGWRAERVTAMPDGGQRFVAVGPDGGRTPMTLPLPGAFNVANALLATACLAQVGVPAAVAAEAMATVSVPGRLQRVDVGQPYLALVDYAHKPAAVAALLDALRERLDGSSRLFVVLGCGGDRDAAKRPLMGAEAAARADLLVITDDNPRSEDPATIRAAVRAGAEHAPPRGDVLEVADRRAAITVAVRRAGPGDVVVVAGKGHESGQRVGAVTHPFSDLDELTAAVRDTVRDTVREGGR